MTQPRLKGSYDIQALQPGEQGPSVPVRIDLPEDEAKLEQAIGIIADYVVTGGQNNVGSTGFGVN